MLSHTPFRSLAARYADEAVLVAGRGQVGLSAWAVERGGEPWMSALLRGVLCTSAGVGASCGQDSSEHSPLHPPAAPQVLDVALHYGFRHVVTPSQLARAMPAAVPFQ